MADVEMAEEANIGESVSEEPMEVEDAIDATVTNPPTITTDTRTIALDPLTVTTDTPIITTELSTIATDSPTITAEPPTITTDSTEITTEPLIITNDPQAITTEPPTITNDPPAISTDTPTITTETAAITTKPPTTKRTKKVELQDEFFKLRKGENHTDPYGVSHVFDVQTYDNKIEVYDDNAPNSVVLQSHAVCFGKIRGRVVPGRFHITKGALCFNMEIQFPADVPEPGQPAPPNLRKKSTHKTQIKIMFNHIKQILFPHFEKNGGAFAVMFLLSDFAIARLKLFLKELKLQEWIWNDNAFTAFVFETPYNFYAHYDFITYFINSCEYWSKSFFPNNENICGMVDLLVFNDMLLETDTYLRCLNSSDGYAMFRFGNIPDQKTPKEETVHEFRPITENSMFVVLPKQTVRFEREDLLDLLDDCYLNDDMIDFYINVLFEKIPEEDRKRISVIPSNLFRQFLQNFGPVDEVTIKSDIAKVVEELRDKVKIEHDIFDKEFLIIPMCELNHWYVVIVMNPSVPLELATNFKRPSTIICLDSLPDHIDHSKTRWNVACFLNYHFHQLKTLGKYSNVPLYRYEKLTAVIPQSIPRQQNNYDCGVYLLQFLEQFLKNLPKTTGPLNLRLNWTTQDAKLYRKIIHKAILDKVEQNKKRKTTPPLSSPPPPIEKVVEEDNPFDRTKYSLDERMATANAKWGHLFAQARALKNINKDI